MRSLSSYIVSQANAIQEGTYPVIGFGLILSLKLARHELCLSESNDQYMQSNQDKRTHSNRAVAS